MTQRGLEILSEAECFELIRQEIIGRLVFQDAEGLGAVPVNYAVAGEQIVFRTEQSSHLRDMLKAPVAFEVDHTNAETGAGWSVLIRGDGHEVEMGGVPEILRLNGKAFPHPWAEGVHNIWISITARRVTGRRLTAPYFAAIF